MQLTKHHGLGNDFLVLLDPDGTVPVSPDTAVALCSRHTGLGADGLLRVTAGADGADVTMELLNADGSVAEMSGNGIRCLAQAVFRAGITAPPTLRVATAAGLRTVTLVDTIDERTQRLQVEMGQAKPIADAVVHGHGPDRRATTVDVGNPHLVIHWGDDPLPVGSDLIELGRSFDSGTPGGTNVEAVRLVGEDVLEMVVYERGVGPTQACGTGACAVAAAASQWGLVGDHATVRMPGGPVEITLGDPVLLTGDATFIAVIDVPYL